MNSHNNHKPYREMSFWQLVKTFIISRLPVQKERVSDEAISQMPEMPESEINYIAIVLDGVVEDVMRAQNRLAALLLSEPTFVEFDPKKERPQIGITKYSQGKFEYPDQQLMTDEELKKTLEKMEIKKDED